MSVWCHIEGSDLTASQVLPMHSGAAGTSANSVKQCLWQVSRSHCLDIATAERDGDDYILNGRKVYIGNSHVGDLHGVVVRTGTGSKGLSAFLVDSDQPGLSLAPHKQAMGLHGFSFGELIFDNCRVPVPPD